MTFSIFGELVLPLQTFADVSSISVERLYPLSPHQNTIFTDITSALSTRQSTLYHHESPTANTATWEKFRILLGKPGTGKSQVLICVIDYAIRSEMSVLVAAPLALLAQGYNAIFLADIDTDTLHGAFNILIHGPHLNYINYALNKYDLAVIDEASDFISHFQHHGFYIQSHEHTPRCSTSRR